MTQADGGSMHSLFPEGLTQKEFALLTECANSVKMVPRADLVKRAEAHFEQVRKAHADNLFINLNLAKAILGRFRTVIKSWNDLPEHSHPWLKAMIYYFYLSSDLECDFTSPIGFDDDVDIMNACLRLAGREDLCINPEDFDDV